MYALNFEREGVKEKEAALNFEREGVKSYATFLLLKLTFSLTFNLKKFVTCFVSLPVSIKLNENVL